MISRHKELKMLLIRFCLSKRDKNLDFDLISPWIYDAILKTLKGDRVWNFKAILLKQNPML